MSADLRWDQCCESAGCKKPAHHGALCASCFYAATPARRAVELLASAPAPDAALPRADDYVTANGAAWLAGLWAA